MSKAVELVLDEAAADDVRRCWHSLAKAGLAPYMFKSGSVPHITLCIFDTLELGPTEVIIESRAKSMCPLPVELVSFGIFPGESPVLFLEPVVTQEMLQLQQEIHAALSPFAEGPVRHYIPGNWVPHCTVALDFPPALLGNVIDTCVHTALPIHGHADALALVDFPPLTYLGKYPLAVCGQGRK